MADKKYFRPHSEVKDEMEREKLAHRLKMAALRAEYVASYKRDKREETQYARAMAETDNYTMPPPSQPYEPDPQLVALAEQIRLKKEREKAEKAEKAGNPDP